jgi:DNA-binding winged helix-turn-helix (wHTH) protein
MDDFVAIPPGGLPRQTIVGEFRLDRETIRVWRKDKPIQLSMRQFRLLDLFMRRPDTPFSFDELRLAIWGSDSTIEEGTVATEVGRLRHALGFRYGKNPLKAVRGVGFLFEADPSRVKPRRPRRPSNRALLDTDAFGFSGQDEGDGPAKD